MTSRHYLDTGQHGCHADDGRKVACEGSGQDASYAIGTSQPEPRFEMSDVIVMDRLTSLMWSRSANLAEFPLTWQEAFELFNGWYWTATTADISPSHARYVALDGKRIL